MTELKLKLPIKVLKYEAPEGETTNGFTIIDANESEFYFNENKETGEFEYDGCCVEPQQIEVITQHLQSETIVLDFLKKQVGKEQLNKCYHPLTERKHTSDIHFECTICGYNNY